MTSKNEFATIVIQCRVGSRRFRRKCFAQIGEHMMIERIFLQCKSANLQNRIILSTSDNKEDAELHEVAQKNGVLVSSGPLDDVVLRLFEASQLTQSNTIVRIWGDCPLICPKLIDEAIEKHISNDAIFTMTDTTNSYPKGQDLEIYNKKYLKKMHESLPINSEYRTFPRDYFAAASL